MIKTKEQPSIKRGSVYLETGMTLTEIIGRLKEAGVKDFSKVTYDHEYIGCQCDHGDGYCYCPSTYTDMRFDWEI